MENFFTVECELIYEERMMKMENCHLATKSPLCHTSGHRQQGLVQANTGGWGFDEEQALA